MAIEAPQTFSEVEKTSLRDKVAQIIQDRILAGDFRAGDRIAEIAVARQMRVGQNTVREALQIVEHQGLVNKVPHVGTFVAKLSDDEVSQIYRVRVELEPLAAELTTQRLDPSGVDLLDQMAEQLFASEESHDYARYLRGILGVHRAVWQLSGNRFLERALLDMSHPLFAYLLITEGKSGPPNVRSVTERHCTLVNVIKTRDVVKAREYCRHVVQESWENTLRKLRELAIEPKTP